MIYGKSRKVVVVQNIDSGIVEQAILILKKDPEVKEFYASEEGIVQEAQKIIEQYQQNYMKTSGKKEKKKLPFALFIISLIAFISSVVYLIS